MADIIHSPYPEDITLENAHDLVTPLMRAIYEKRHKHENVSLEKALGRILADNVTAKINVPCQDTAAVDGYAFYFDDLDKPLPITGSIKAGHPYQDSAKPGQAYRIFTGAVMPDGPDTIAMQEYCEFDKEGRVVLPHTIKRGTNYRPAGENISKGEIAIQQGTVISSADIGLAAAVGCVSLTVQPKLKVAVISIGDEVVDPQQTETLKLGEIFDSNRPMLKVMMQNMGHDVIDYGIISDDLDTVTRALIDAATNTDIILCSGGSSEGDEDHTKSAILNSGGVIDFWRLALKPGRPMISGRINDTPVFGLPGNPVAVFVCTRLFAGPMLDVLQGGDGCLPPKIKIPAGFSKPHRKGRAEYLRARLDNDGSGGVHIVINGRPGAGVLSSLTGADGLVEIPTDYDDVNIGDELPFLMFREAAL